MAAVTANGVGDLTNNATEGKKEDVVSNIEGEVNKLSLNENTNQANEANSEKVTNENNEEELFWGFSLHEAYSMAIKFYKDNDGKQTFSMLPYGDKIHLAALTKQVSHGPFNQQSNLPEIGYLDMFGHDRRRIWGSLADMSSNDARRNFLKSLDKAVPVFGPFMDAHRTQREEEIRKKREEERRRIQEEEERKRQIENERLAAKAEEERLLQDSERMEIEKKRQIKSALNAQTLPQFQQYAAQQFPGNAEQQASLIAQLQEQHYQQYIKLQEQQSQQMSANTQTQQNLVQGVVETANNASLPDEQASEDQSEDVITVCEPSLWTRPQIDEFKKQIKRDPESVLTVGRGEVVTVRVPTHEEGAYIFWEFATDHYDLGFGVYFEWTDSLTNDVSVHVNESSDDENSDMDDYEESTDGDVEKAPGSSKQKPLADEIVPVFRRECHTQVHAGSHRYPGRGIYLLKFDNSYSLWRSKTLYYRVYYTR